MRKYKNIVFDLGGVLINLDVDRCIESFVRLLGEHNVRLALGMSQDGEGVAAVSVASRELMYNYERGKITTDEFFNQLFAFANPGTTVEQLKSAWLDMLLDIPLYRLQLLEDLRKEGYRIFLLSNSNELHWTVIFRKYQLDKYFDKIYASHLLHQAKPQPELFLSVDEEIGKMPKETIYVDDLLTNRQAAENTVGWQTCETVEELLQKL